jgi:t-SNARE complex subunit (syntaxin)
MFINVALLYPAVITFAATLVAGGIARSNLIATKETKVSEFRQAWINSLREELATLFSNTRTLARAVQENRSPQPEKSSQFHFSQDKITAVRHGAAETYYRIKLRLNREQDDHKELLRLLSEMMAAQQRYIDDLTADVQLPLSNVEKASEQAEKVLKSEWRTVKGGEEAYKSAINTTSWVLIISGSIWVIVVVGALAYAFFTGAESEATNASAPAPQQLPTRATPPTVVAPTPRQLGPAVSKPL